MSDFIWNTTDTNAAKIDQIEGVEVEGLQIILKMVDGPDRLFETAQDAQDLATKVQNLKDTLE